MNRLGRLCETRFDLAVIGGGILGSGIARDAALRGLKVALIEAGDFGQGASSRSSRLIHGGLRYLEHLEFRLVREDLREREVLLRIAPHLVRPLPFLVPIYGGLSQRAKLQAGMLLYDLLSFDKSLPPHKWLSPAKAIAAEPSLRRAGLKGAFLYYDAQAASVERLCIENAIAAQEKGAVVANYARLSGFSREDRGVSGLEVTDITTGQRVAVQARLTINATGPWLDSTLSLMGQNSSPLLRRTKGVHLVAPKSTDHALVLFAGDGRLFFVIPWQNLSLVGTTDTDFEGDPGSAAASGDDVLYLAESVKKFVPAGPWDQIYYAMAGVRPLIRQAEVRESAISRGHKLADHGEEGLGGGLISVVGGKITGYRAIAEETVDLALRRLGKPHQPAITAREPLPGARFADWEAYVKEAMGLGEELGLDDEQSRNLTSLYGSRALEVLALIERDRRLAKRVCQGAPDILAQVKYSVEREMALKPADFLLRRSMLGLSPCLGFDCVPVVCEEMGDLLGWNEAQRRSEAQAYLAEIGSSRLLSLSSTTAAHRTPSF